MAKVDFLQATDMSAIPTSVSGVAIRATPTEIDYTMSDGFNFLMLGSFQSDQSTGHDEVGTINHVLLDTPDFGDFPNIEITELSFNSTVGIQGRLFSSPAQFVSDLLSGDDTLNGSSGSDTLISFAGNDILNGGMGADNMSGGTGDDWYFVDNAGDTITELAGQGTLDRVFASVSYNLTPGAEIEIMSTANHAGTEAINLRGNELANTIFGNAGMNIISGGLGNDTLVGLGGNDYFLFERTPGVGNVEQIGDFTPGQDHVLLVQSVFTSLSTGVLADANLMVRGTALQDANDFIIYDQSTGGLFYDADGSGAGAAVPFANVTANLPLHASDFQIV